MFIDVSNGSHEQTRDICPRVRKSKFLLVIPIVPLDACKRYTHISRPMYFLKVKCDNTNDNRKKENGTLNQSAPSSLKRSLKYLQFFNPSTAGAAYIRVFIFLLAN